MLRVSDACAADRLRVCAGCPSVKIVPVFGEVCGECGCFMRVKAKLAAVECPIGKWPAVDPDKARLEDK